MRKDSVVNVFFILLLAMLGALPYSTAFAGTPKAVFPVTSFSFGDVKQGKPIVHTFSVVNRGDAPLKIERVRPGCGCTLASFDRVIPPGGEGKITLKVDTTGYQGKITKSARVYTNDPVKRMIVLSLSAVIKVPIYLSSRYVYFYGVEGQHPQTRVVDIIAKKDKPLELTPEKYTLGDKIAYDLKEIEKGKKFRVTFTNKTMAAGAYYGHLQIKTNYKEQPEIIIRVRARILKRRRPVTPRHSSTKPSQNAG